MLGTGLEVIGGDDALLQSIRESGWLWPMLVVQFFGRWPLGLALIASGTSIVTYTARHGRARPSGPPDRPR